MTTPELPDKCLLTIFRHVPLQECVRFRVICRQWNVLITAKCHEQKSLKLFESFACLERYCDKLLTRNQTSDDDLKLKPIGLDDDFVLGDCQPMSYPQFVSSCSHKSIDPTASRATSHFIAQLFPAIEKLVIFFEVNSKIDILFLLAHYRPNLTSLSLGLCTTETFFTPGDADLDKLWPHIHSMPQLRSLHLSGLYPICAAELTTFLPTLERLSQDKFDCYYCPTLTHIAGNLKQLTIDEFRSYDSDVVQQIVAENPQLPARIEKLTVCDMITGGNLSSFETIFAHFSSLTSLALSFEYQQTNLDWITLRLSQLPNLTDLALVLEAIWFDSNDSSNLRPLKSIKTLKLKLLNYSKCPINCFSATVFIIFPNLDRLSIECEYRDSVDFTSMDDFLTFAAQHSSLVTLNGDYRQFDYLPLMGRHRHHYQNVWLADEVIANYELDEETDESDSDCDEEIGEEELMQIQDEEIQ